MNATPGLCSSMLVTKRNYNEHTNLFFNGFDYPELGIIDLLVEMFVISGKIWERENDPYALRTHGI